MSRSENRGRYFSIVSMISNSPFQTFVVSVKNGTLNDWTESLNTTDFFLAWYVQFNVGTLYNVHNCGVDTVWFLNNIMFSYEEASNIFVKTYLHHMDL